MRAVGSVGAKRIMGGGLEMELGLPVCACRGYRCK